MGLGSVLRRPSRSLNEVTHAAKVTASKNTKEDDLQCKKTGQTDQLVNLVADETDSHQNVRNILRSRLF